jgi:hypothetical protein
VSTTAPLGATRKAAPSEFAVPLMIRPLNWKLGSHAPVFVTPWETQLPSNWLAACALGEPARVAQTVVVMSACVSMMKFFMSASITDHERNCCLAIYFTLSKSDVIASTILTFIGN